LYGSYGLTIKYSATGVKQWQSLLHLYNFTPVDLTLGTDTSVFVISSPAATVARFLQKGNTQNCSTPGNLKTVSVTNNAATVTWKKVSGVFLYYLQYKTTDAAEWTQVTADSNRYTIQNLQQGTSYTFRVQAICASEPSGLSAAANFTTTGTGYCASKGPDNNCQWIDGVQLGNINTYPSGPDNGYGDFTNLSANITQGSTYTITTNKYNLCGSTESWRIWIDYNHDGDFDDANERVIQYSNNFNYDYHDFTVPSTALTGTTRMRVSMKAGSLYSTPCEMLADGEVEDYTVNILPSTSSIANANVAGNNDRITLAVSPNPASHILHIQAGGFKNQVVVDVFDALGMKVSGKKITTLGADLNIDNLKPGIYLLSATDEEGNRKSVKFIKQ